MIVVQLLGTAQVNVGSTRVLPSSPRKFALLLYLVAEVGRRTARPALQDLVFPDQPEKNARHSLRELVYQLRQAGAQIVSDPHGIQLRREEVASDVDALTQGGRLTNDQLSAVEGGFLPGYAPGYSEAFDEWLEAYRARMTFELCKVLLSDMTRAKRVGDWRRAERSARACLGLDALNEEATLGLAEALAAGGAKARAVDLLDQYMGEVDGRSHDLRLPASVLRRRIGERASAYVASSPFVGRDGEMTVLHDYLRRAHTGRSQVVAVVGEAGIGKSRLVSEFCRVVALDGVHVASTIAEPHDSHRPFGVFADLLPKLLNLPGSLGISPESLRLLDRLVKGPSTEPPPFLEAVRDSDAFCHSITHAIIDLIDAIAGEGTLLLVFEDVRSLDSMSLRLLDSLPTARQRRRLCAVITTRDTRSLEGIATTGDLGVIELLGMDSQSIDTVIESFAMHSAVALDVDLSRWLRDTSAGNPLFLESLLAHYANTRERFSISPTLSSLLRRRVEVLSEHAGAALQACAILGKYATLETILDATQLPRFEVVRGIGELETARLIVGDGQHVRPVHALIADVVQRRLTPLERRLSHQCAATALESQLHRDPSAALVWEVAEHWLAASNTQQALAAIRRCASHAVEIGRPGDAAQMLARALSLPIGASERAAIGAQLVPAADAAADSESVLRGVEALRADRRPARHDEAEFAEFRARARVYYDGHGQEVQLLRCLAADDAPADHRVSAATQLLKYADTTCDPALSRSTIEALPDDVLQSVDDLARLEYIMIRHSALHDFDAAGAAARQVLTLADGAPVMTRLKMRLNALLALYHSGFLEDATSVAERSYREAIDAGAHRFSLILATFLAEHHFDLCDDEAAAPWIDRMNEIVDACPTLATDFFQGTSHLGRALAIGNLEAARALFDRLDRARVFEGGPIRARWRRAFLLRLSQLGGSPAADETELSELIAATGNAASVLSGLCDLEAATVCHALLDLGDRCRTREFFDEYRGRHRVSRAPLSRCLAFVAQEID